MTVGVEWSDIALRLALTVAAGALLGMNRSERGRPAGLCTTSLVCLAAAAAMIQANLLLPVAGKPSDSFITLDLMRLPLGILTGMGFIGGGAILRRGDVVQGVTTAATLWTATVIGLCFGGGQIGLGIASLGLAMLILSGFKQLELRMQQDRHATLTLCAVETGPTEEQFRADLLAAGYSIDSWAVTHRTRNDSRRRTMGCRIRWRGRLTDSRLPALIHQLEQRPGVLSLRWKSLG